VRGALIVSIVGLVAILIVVLFFSFSFFPGSPVDDVDQAKVLAEQFVMRQGFDFAVKEIMEFTNHYYVVIVEKNTDVNAFELLVDRVTGRVFYEPGPNMMWNTKYGHHSRQSDPTTNMPITSQVALRNAQGWLDQNFPGGLVYELKMFYGYYTVDFSINNRMVGMLSVNGYSGEVWYHSWHGQFIKMVEYD
jgi:hypothetical protein